MSLQAKLVTISINFKFYNDNLKFSHRSKYIQHPEIKNKSPLESPDNPKHK